MSTDEIIDNCRKRDSKHEIIINTRSPIEGTCVYRWPEYQAFMERLGIDWTVRQTKTVITIACDDVVKVIQHYHAVDTKTAPREITLVEDPTSGYVRREDTRKEES